VAMQVWTTKEIFKKQRNVGQILQNFRFDQNIGINEIFWSTMISLISQAVSEVMIETEDYDVFYLSQVTENL
jgi:hypothetical protein